MRTAVLTIGANNFEVGEQLFDRRIVADSHLRRRRGENLPGGRSLLFGKGMGPGRAGGARDRSECDNQTTAISSRYLPKTLQFPTCGTIES